MFEHVPLNSERDVNIAVRPRDAGVYELSPYPFAADAAEYAFAGRTIERVSTEKNGGWSAVLAKSPTIWERFVDGSLSSGLDWCDQLGPYARFHTRPLFDGRDSNGQAWRASRVVGCAQCSSFLTRDQARGARAWQDSGYSSLGDACMTATASACSG